MLKALVLVAVLESSLVTAKQAQSDHTPSSPPRNQENTYKGLKQAFLDRSQPGEFRARRLHEMVMTDADQAFAIMPEALLDADPFVREEAAEWLAIRGDSRGLDAKMECIPQQGMRPAIPRHRAHRELTSEQLRAASRQDCE